MSKRLISVVILLSICWAVPVYPGCIEAVRSFLKKDDTWFNELVTHKVLEKKAKAFLQLEDVKKIIKEHEFVAQSKTLETEIKEWQESLITRFKSSKNQPSESELIAFLAFDNPSFRSAAFNSFYEGYFFQYQKSSKIFEQPFILARRVLHQFTVSRESAFKIWRSSKKTISIKPLNSVASDEVFFSLMQDLDRVIFKANHPEANSLIIYNALLEMDLKNGESINIFKPFFEKTRARMSAERALYESTILDAGKQIRPEVLKDFYNYGFLKTIYFRLQAKQSNKALFSAELEQLSFETSKYCNLAWIGLKDFFYAYLRITWPINLVGLGIIAKEEIQKKIDKIKLEDEEQEKQKNALLYIQKQLGVCDGSSGIQQLQVSNLLERIDQQENAIRKYQNELQNSDVSWERKQEIYFDRLPKAFLALQELREDSVSCPSANK